MLPPVGLGLRAECEGQRTPCRVLMTFTAFARAESTAIELRGALPADLGAEGEVPALECGADGGRSGHQRIKLLRHQGNALLPRPHLPVGLRSERLRLEQTLATSITQGGMQHQRVT